MTSAYDDMPVRQSLKDLRAEYPDHQGLADEKYYKHRLGLPDDTYIRRRRSINRHFDELDEQGLGPQDSKYYDPKPQGGPSALGQTKPKNQPLLISNHPHSPARSSDQDDDDAGQDRLPTKNPYYYPPGLATDAQGDYLYQDRDDIEQMFAKVGGLGEGRKNAPADPEDADGAQAESGEAPGSKKLGWGSRIWNGLKGIGGILKNVTGYNLIRHGLFGANFRRGKVNKNFKKATALINQIQAAAPGSDERQKLESEYTKVDHKLNTNRSKLGLHRQYYTGRMMAREFTRLGRGTDLKMRENEGFRHFMTGGIEGGRDPHVAAAVARSKARAAEPEPALEPERLLPARRAPLPQAPQQRMQPPAQQQLANDDFEVIRNQQAHDDNDDLEYDENGKVIFQ